MKPIKNPLNGLFIIGGLVALAGLMQAQVATTQGQSDSSNTPPPDSVVQIAAEAQGLSPASPDQIPPDRCGTFWIVTGDTFPAPWPYLPAKYDLTNTPIFSLDSTRQSFLVDGTTATNGMSAADLEAQGNMVLDFITQLQESLMNAALHTMAVAMGLESDNGEMGSSFMIDTNGLWLEITNVADGLAYLNLHNGTDFVYEVWSKTDLSATNWDIETEVFPGTNRDVMPFTVSQSERTKLFIWARDWTGITSGGNAVPEWWLWEYFQTTQLSDTNLDSQGNTLLSDYQSSADPNGGNETPEWWFWKYFHRTDLSDTNLDSIGQQLLIDYQYGVDPNLIFFTLQFPNEVHTNILSGTVAILGGTPFYTAVLVNDTNDADVVWLPYTGSNIVVSLNSGDGVYAVRVGLRGLPDDTQPTWEQAELINSAPVTPVISITNPVSATVSTPMIQLQGFVNETLSELTYDVSNAVGVITNQLGYWQAEFYDTNVLQFTTNSFQCYDIALTNGLNVITLHAVDETGNTATTNLSVTLDYSTDATPPMLILIWPQDGMAISGSNFILQAQVDDATATVAASITDASGETNTVQGLVERSGMVWVNDLPLAAGMNILTLTTTDAAGNSTTTNLTLVQSGVMVTMDPLPDDQLNQSSVNVTGTVSDPNVNLAINGRSATVYEDGTWQATDVPASATGTANFIVELTDLSNQPVGSQAMSRPEPAVISLMSYVSHYYHDEVDSSPCAGGTRTETINWTYKSGGLDSWSVSEPGGDCQPGQNPPPIVLSAGYNGYSPNWENNSASGGSYLLPHWDWIYYLNYWSYNSAWWQVSWTSDAHARVMIVPSGPVVPGQSALYLVSAQVMDEDTDLQLPASEVWFQNQLPGNATVDVTNDDESVWSQGLVLGPSGVPVEATPTASGNYNFSPPLMQVTNVRLKIFTVTNGTAIDLSTNTPEFCVGQKVAFIGMWDHDPGAVSTNYIWAFSTKYVNHSSQSSSSASTNWDIDPSIFSTNEPYAYWVSGGNKDVYLKEILRFSNGQSGTFSASGQFSIYRPTGSIVRRDLYGTPLVVWNPVWNSLSGGAISVGTTASATNSMGYYGGILSKYHGKGKWVQIIDLSMTGAGYIDGIIDYNPACYGVLDNQDPYGPTPTIFPNLTNNVIPLEDSPQAKNAGGTIRLYISCTDYMMFQPDDGIWVPLGKTQTPWGINCYATRPSLDILPTNTVTEPGDLDGSTDFPQWSDTFSNP
jgi:hypothetical protein